ncbi:MAG: hypothetical protein NTW87_15535 [Planctomycetota bacterium]|nr:hypothetical protein [Planctomycetota bacterium]
MKQALLASGLLAFAFLLGGCTDDDRTTDEKLHSPPPEFTTRYTMACPKCGAPQKPFRINAVKSFYRCTGQPPRFPYHQEKRWEHKICDEKDSVEQ